jgi:hypothetical protein
LLSCNRTFEIVYRRLVFRLRHNKTIGAIAHRLGQLIWMILHNGVRYEERGAAQYVNRLSEPAHREWSGHSESLAAESNL